MYLITITKYSRYTDYETQESAKLSFADYNPSVVQSICLTKFTEDEAIYRIKEIEFTLETATNLTEEYHKQLINEHKAMMKIWKSLT